MIAGADLTSTCSENPLFVAGKPVAGFNFKSLWRNAQRFRYRANLILPPSRVYNSNPDDVTDLVKICRYNPIKWEDFGHKFVVP